MKSTKHGYITKDPSRLGSRDLGVAVAQDMAALSKAIGFPTSLKEVPGISEAHVVRCLTAAKEPQLDMKLRNMPVPLYVGIVDEYMGPILRAAWCEDFSPIKVFNQTLEFTFSSIPQLR